MSARPTRPKGVGALIDPANIYDPRLADLQNPATPSPGGVHQDDESSQYDKNIQLPAHNASPRGRRGRKNLIHRVTIEGSYASSGGENGRLNEVPYKVTVMVDDETHQTFGALSAFKGGINRPGLAERILKRKDIRFVRLLTHDLVKCETDGHDRPTDMELFNREDLLTYIEQEQLPIDVNLYDDVGALRQAVYDAEDDPAAFARQQSVLRGRRRAQPDIDRLEKLNADQIHGKVSKSVQDDDLGV